MSKALIMKAPMASPMLKPPANPAVASTAAPGVDQATMTGWRRISEGTSEHSPMPRPSAHIQDVICAGVAPNAWAAWNTMATELVKPTSTATKPATAVERLRSLKNCMGTILSPRASGNETDGRLAPIATLLIAFQAISTGATKKKPPQTASQYLQGAWRVPAVRSRSWSPVRPPRYWAGAGSRPHRWRCGASGRTAFRAMAPCRRRWWG